MWTKCNKKEGFLSMYCNVCLCVHTIQWEEEELSLCECAVYCFGSSCLCGRRRRGRRSSLFKEKQPGEQVHAVAVSVLIQLERRRSSLKRVRGSKAQLLSLESDAAELTSPS